MQNEKTRQVFELALLSLAWFALVLQLCLGVVAELERGVAWQWTVFNYFSYFTILTNLFLAAGLTVPRLRPQSRFGHFLLRPTVRSASLVYIAVVALVYAALLRHLWNPTGWRWLGDVLLHDVIPIGYFVHWVLFVPHARLRWRDALLWLAYPGGYLAYTLLRGEFVGLYPYPFLNVLRLGYQGVLVNSAFLALAFVAMGWLVVILDRHVKGMLAVRVNSRR